MKGWIVLSIIGIALFMACILSIVFINIPRTENPDCIAWDVNFECIYHEQGVEIWQNHADMLLPFPLFVFGAMALFFATSEYRIDKGISYS